MNKKKKKVIIICFILLGFLIISTYTICNYTRIGYMGTISIHGYTEIVDNVYIDKKYTGNSDELIKTISKANERVADFWGTLESKPSIIISSDKEKLKNLDIMEALLHHYTYFMELYALLFYQHPI